MLPNNASAGLHDLDLGAAAFDRCSATWFVSLCRHEWLDGYRWLSVDVANERLRNPDGRRQQVKAALMEQAQPASQRQPHPGE